MNSPRALRGLLFCVLAACSTLRIRLAHAQAGTIDLVRVDTAAKLKRALDNGTEHVHITAHLDLVKLTKYDSGSEDAPRPVYFRNLTRLKSLTVCLRTQAVSSR